MPVSLENDDSDAELMLRVKSGDLEAFEILVNKYQKPVISMICRILPDAIEAEDLAQNVFVQVYKSADRYRATAKFKTWLFTIARNLCLNEIRRRSRHPADSIETATEGWEQKSYRRGVQEHQSAPNQLLRSELEEKITDSLSALPENQRTALMLFHQEDLSYEDISRILKCSLSATKSLIHRARETLKGKIKPYLSSGAWPNEN